MSNLEQGLAAAAGAVIGFVYGGPTGAYYGFQIGLLGGALLFPTELPGREGPRLEDFENLQSDPGAPIFQVYGTAAVPGFRHYLGPVTEVSTTEEVGGKGPGGQDVTTFMYFQTLSLGLCEGPISGVCRIWENGQLVYDARPQQEGESDDAYAARVEMSAEYEETFTLYLGGEDQEADPTLELEQGMGKVPGFRGLAYMVYPDRQLKQEQGLRHPAFKVEVIGRGELTLTSRPYPIEASERAAVSMSLLGSSPVASFGPEKGGIGMSLLSGDLFEPVVDYEYDPPEAAEVSMVLLSGDLFEPVVDLEYEPPEAAEIGMSLLSGTLDVVIVEYSMDDEGADVSFGLLGGDLV